MTQMKAKFKDFFIYMADDTPQYLKENQTIAEEVE